MRKLKSEKAEKAKVDTEVKTLLELKAEYKKATGKDWTPGAPPAAPKSSSNSNEAELSQKIAAQGDKVRDLKQKKADKPTIDAEVKVLLELKAEYKKLTGKDWTPAASNTVAPAAAAPAVSSSNEAELLQKIAAQGDKVRDLKQKKANKAAIDTEVKVLLALKGDYKKLTGQDWKPGAVAAVSQSANVSLAAPSQEASDPQKDELIKKVNEQGNVVRDLKANKAPKVSYIFTIRCLPLNLKIY